MRRLLLNVFVMLVAAAAAIGLSFIVTPMQTVSAVGQTVKVGVAKPSLSWSGPGELDLFGQELPTTLSFVGPVRPRLAISKINFSPELGAAVSAEGASKVAKSLQDALVEGWVRFLAFQVGVVAIIAIALLGMIAGWRRLSRRGSLMLIGLGLVVAELINVGAIMITAYTAPARLRQVSSLQDLVGVAPAPAMARAAHPAVPSDRVVVIGDSTAAGIGNPRVPNPTDIDNACRRSVDSFAAALDRTSEWHVVNLACSSATVREGLLGSQSTGGITVPAQLPTALSIDASAIVVSIGANDVRWSNLIQICATVDQCRNNAVDAFFQQQLAEFTREYLALILQLQSLPDRPRVVINLYYNPLDSDVACLKKVGLTDEKRRTLNDYLSELNKVLSDGAKSASFEVAEPDFTGHGLCSDQPYVQGIDAKAPFHPTAAGALAIALADQTALRRVGTR